MTAWYLTVSSPVGPITLVEEHGGLSRAFLDSQKHAPCPQGGWVGGAGRPILDQAARWLDAYFGGAPLPPLPPLAPAGTEFQQRVWKQMLAIESGATLTYGQLAERAGRPGAARAAGSAAARNPLLILVPCHRVVGASGKLTGYAAGTGRKEFLLEMERSRSLLPSL